MTSTGALGGIRVVEVGLLVQGPQAALTLGDMGADVVKVELPGVGDQARWIPISMQDLRAPFFEGCNRGKRSVTIDLREEAGAGVFRTLVDRADVLIANFKPGTLDEWGLSYEALSETNPGLIYAMGSTFGPSGAGAQREGADIAGQAAGGLISTTGLDGDPVTPVGVTIADHIGSLDMVIGILGALHARQRTGRGQRIDVSLLGGQIYAQASEYTAYLMTGEVPGRANAGHPLIPLAYGVLPTSDGAIAVVGVPVDLRGAFFAAAGVPELADDPRFGGLLFTNEDRAALWEILSERFVTRTTAEWETVLGAIPVRYAPVQDYAQAAADPLVLDNDYIVEVDDPADPDGGRIRVVGSPIRMSDTPTQPSARAPELGQHTEEVLLELGYDWDRIAELREAGVI